MASDYVKQASLAASNLAGGSGAGAIDRADQSGRLFIYRYKDTYDVREHVRVSFVKVTLLLAVVIGLALFLPGSPRSGIAQDGEGPSAFCHVTDGEFTDCPDSDKEWFDITPTVLPEPGGVVYADQADLVDNDRIADFEANPITADELFFPDGEPDHLMLMFESGRTQPLGPDEYVLVHFMTVDEQGDNPEALLHFVVRIYNDAKIQVFVDGVERGPGGRQDQIDTMRGAVGFGPSQTNSTPRVLSEFQIGLSEAGFEICCYSPDPAWWSSTTPPCSVDITPGLETMNFGELAQFAANVTGGDTSVEFQWEVTPDILKNYSETTNDVEFSTTPMGLGDFQNQKIAFYWKSSAEPGPRQVSVEATLADGTTCNATRNINVELDTTDIDRQAEDYYTSNHHEFVQIVHEYWHTKKFPGGSGGSIFFDFHRRFLDGFNSWRNEFGYPNVIIWKSGIPIPPGVEIDHDGRKPSPTGDPKPGYLTKVGGSTNLLESCSTFGGGGQTMLENFNANRDLLGCVTENVWHNSVHNAIGGDMEKFRDAVRDPVFWRWHEYVDTVSQDRASLTPPTVVYQSPFRLFRFITEIPSVSVTFSRPVTGVTADDLTVNGSPASGVVGSDEGPYVFTGYERPALGPITVSIGPGAIQNFDDEAFAGTSWSHTLIDPTLDEDNDGVNDGLEATQHLTDPTNPDTDGDGLPDGFEIDNTCLNPLEDEANPLSHGTPPPGDDDADNDGKTNLEEFLLETDPCSFTFTPGQLAIRTGFDSNTLPANDDGSAGQVPIGFTTKFFGIDYDSLFVNINGNVTFVSPHFTFTPSALTTTGPAIIAPFFSDVDNRVGAFVTYGPGTVDGRPAFGATWPSVGCASVDSPVRNFFQVVLIDRSDVAPGDFDIEFNYDSIQWETGQASGGDVSCQGGASARVGFSSGTGEPGTFFELPGSGIPGSFLDPDTDAGLIHNSLNTAQLGRYLFPVRTGVPITADRDGDKKPAAEDNCPGTANPEQQDSNFDGIGDACQETTALDTTAFLQANLDGTTGGEATVTATGEHPLEDQITRIVQFRIDEGRTDDFEQLTKNLVDSQVDLDLVTPEQGEQLVKAVLEQLDHDGDGHAYRWLLALAVAVAIIFALALAIGRAYLVVISRWSL